MYNCTCTVDAEEQVRQARIDEERMRLKTEVRG